MNLIFCWIFEHQLNSETNLIRFFFFLSLSFSFFLLLLILLVNIITSTSHTEVFRHASPQKVHLIIHLELRVLFQSLWRSKVSKQSPTKLAWVVSRPVASGSVRTRTCMVPVRRHLWDEKASKETLYLGWKCVVRGACTKMDLLHCALWSPFTYRARVWYMMLRWPSVLT